MVVRSDWQRQASSRPNERMLSITSAVWKWLKISSNSISEDHCWFHQISNSVCVCVCVVSRIWAGWEQVFINLFNFVLPILSKIYLLFCHSRLYIWHFIYHLLWLLCTCQLDFNPYNLLRNTFVTVHNYSESSPLNQWGSLLRPHCIKQNATRHF